MSLAFVLINTKVSFILKPAYTLTHRCHQNTDKRHKIFFFFFCVPQLYLWGSPISLRFLRMWPFLNPTIEVVTFYLRGWRRLCVFVAGLHPSRTWMSGSFESVQWNAYCVNRLDLSIYSHPKEFFREWSPSPCQLQGKNPLYWRFRGGSNPRTCIMQDSEHNALQTELFWPQRDTNTLKHIYAHIHPHTHTHIHTHTHAPHTLFHTNTSARPCSRTKYNRNKPPASTNPSTTMFRLTSRNTRKQYKDQENTGKTARKTQMETQVTKEKRRMGLGSTGRRTRKRKQHERKTEEEKKDKQKKIWWKWQGGEGTEMNIRAKKKKKKTQKQCTCIASRASSRSGRSSSSLSVFFISSCTHNDHDDYDKDNDDDDDTY